MAPDPIYKSSPSTKAGATHYFPPPWSVEELDACFVLRGANGQARCKR